MGFALSDIQLTSTAIESVGSIPRRHTGEGVDVSPPLVWSNVPEGTESFAVVCHDPDAPLVTMAGYGFVHWVLYGIPNDVRSLSEGDARFTQGNNDFGNSGYGGPMPPPGHGVHHYYFWILAVGSSVDLESGLTMTQLFEKLEADVIGMNRLIGTYRRD